MSFLVLGIPFSPHIFLNFLINAIDFSVKSYSLSNTYSLLYLFSNLTPLDISLYKASLHSITSTSNTSSIDNNLYSVLDDITFITSDILKDNNFEKIFGKLETFFGFFRL